MQPVFTAGHIHNELVAVFEKYYIGSGLCAVGRTYRRQVVVRRARLLHKSLHGLPKQRLVVVDHPVYTFACHLVKSLL